MTPDDARRPDPPAGTSQVDTTLIAIVSEPGSLSLLRALSLLSVSGLSPHALELRHLEPHGRALARIWLPDTVDRERLSAVTRKIGQLPTVWSVEESHPAGGPASCALDV